MGNSSKTIIFWILILGTAVALYSAVRSIGAEARRAPSTVQIEYSVMTVAPSTDLRSLLDNKGNEGWELASPVVNNGTTTALIFKRARK